MIQLTTIIFLDIILGNYLADNKVWKGQIASKDQKEFLSLHL